MPIDTQTAPGDSAVNRRSHNPTLILTSTACLTILVATGFADEVQPYSSSEVLDRPAIFAADIVSSPLPEFATAFSPTGDLVVFNRSDADRNDIVMMASEFRDGAWAEPSIMPFSSTYRDVDPWFSSDGSRLYFSSNRPAGNDSESASWDTWYVEKRGTDWSVPARLGPAVNTDATEIFVSITDDGTLFFRRSTPESRGIYSAQSSGDGFAIAEPVLGLELESAGNPAIARDGSFLILSGIVEGRAGDLFISFPQGDKWTPARNLGESVNTMFAEFAPSVSPDGKYLFFTSERPGVMENTTDDRPPGDIYQIELRKIEGIDWPD